MRRLIYIPVIHSEEDMGSMAEPIKQQYIQKFGIDKWRQHVRTVNDMWEGIEEKIEALKLNYKKVIIYQDGLPLCGKEIEIMEDVAKLGSHNYNMILKMVKKGASLIGTEDARLLVEEYNFIKKFTEITGLDERKRALKRAKKQRDELLIKRDRFIAKRIKETLKTQEAGILFCGIEHEVTKYLPKNIKVEYIIYRLPFKELQQRN